MKVLIIGGSGFIGRALVSELSEAGNEPVVCTRSPVPPDSSGSSRVRWNGISPEALARIMDGLGPGLAVVNLAGENIAKGRWTEARRRRILDSRVGPSRALALAAFLADAPPAVVVQGSAVGYYGALDPEDDHSRFDEDSPPGNGFLAQVCREWEAASGPLQAGGVRLAVVRTGAVLGRGGGALAPLMLPMRLFVGGPPGGDQWVPWVHLADEVGAIRFLLEDESAFGPYNVAAPEPVTMRRLCALVGRAMGRPSWLGVPPFLLRLALGPMADEVVLASQRVHPGRLERSGYRFRHPSAQGAVEDMFR